MAEQGAGQGAGPRATGLSVLVVDDEENLNWSLVTSLRRDSYLADGALSGEEALHRLAQRRYDFVISDVKMPGMDGFELLDFLRRHHPATRVIMMTAFGSPTARQDAFRGGVVAFLEKPFDLRALKAELRRLAESGAGQTGGGFDILDIAQVISLTRRDLTLAIANGAVRGELRFAQGELMWAGADNLRGDAAFYALAIPRAQSAEPHARGTDPERNITQPLSRLIFQALTARARGASTPTDPALPRSGEATAPTQPLNPRTPKPDWGAAPPQSRSAMTNPPAWTTIPTQVGEQARTPRATTTGAPTAPLGSPWEVSSVWPGAAQGQSAPRADEQAVAAVVAVGVAPKNVETGSVAGGERVGERVGELVGDVAGSAAGSTTGDGRTRRVTQALARLVQALGGHWCAVITTADGTMIARHDEGFPTPSDGMYTHLAAAAQSSARALLLADWGILEEAHLYSPQAFVLARRLDQGERSGLCVLAGPRLNSSDGAARQAEHAVSVLRDHLAEIVAALS